jgi:hypothetical protein
LHIGKLDRPLDEEMGRWGVFLAFYLCPRLWTLTFKLKEMKTQTLPRHDQTTGQRDRNNRHLVIGYTGSRLLPAWLTCSHHGYQVMSRVTLLCETSSPILKRRCTFALHASPDSESGERIWLGCIPERCISFPLGITSAKKKRKWSKETKKSRRKPKRWLPASHYSWNIPASTSVNLTVYGALGPPSYTCTPLGSKLIDLSWLVN